LIRSEFRSYLLPKSTFGELLAQLSVSAFEASAVLMTSIAKVFDDTCSALVTAQCASTIEPMSIIQYLQELFWCSCILNLGMRTTPSAQTKPKIDTGVYRMEYNSDVTTT
jgi:hypothetical protein